MKRSLSYPNLACTRVPDVETQKKAALRDIQKKRERERDSDSEVELIILAKKFGFWRME